MARRFRHGFLRCGARLSGACGCCSSTCLRLISAWLAGTCGTRPRARLLTAASRIRIARCLSVASRLAFTWRTIAAYCVAVAFLSVLRTRRARRFGRNVCRWHEAIDRDTRYLRLDQALNVFEVIQLFTVDQ